MLPRPGICGRHLPLKIAHTENKVLYTTGNFPRCTPVCDVHVTFKLPYVYDYITKLSGKKQKSYKIMRMNMFAAQDKVKPDTENLRGGGQAYDRSSD
jgi:hypothetical protein